MTYKEFKDAYGWMVSKYPDTYSFCGLMDDAVGTEIKTTYKKIGSRWHKEEQEEHKIVGEWYCNVIEAIPFFRNIGGYEKVEMSYTYMGYIPVKVSSISPDKSKKIVREYKFSR